uniref:Macaca fascicularis brain cDNA clone: QflA-17719, similar to human FLJ46299 protein (FLJ46299), mRNA, RefSeq: NM_207335.1 n=1 Tax=Macaca fascicularis TaxID=9541 RepID=I7G5H4_MACFA|nr:unnamed protein product [Macaca fascicularis]
MPSCDISLHLYFLPVTQPKVFISESSMSLLHRTIKMLMVPGSASLASTADSYFCRQELLTLGWVSAPAFYILFTG